MCVCVCTDMSVWTGSKQSLKSAAVGRGCWQASAAHAECWRHRQPAGHANSTLCTVEYTASFFPDAEQLHFEEGCVPVALDCAGHHGSKIIGKFALNSTRVPLQLSHILLPPLGLADLMTVMGLV